MADRNYNRDRNRPYDEDYDEDFYDQDFGSRGRYDRGIGMDSRNDTDYGYQGSRFYGRYGSNFGSNQGGYNRGYNRGMGASGYGGYGRNRDYDYDYDNFDAEWGRGSDWWNQGNYGGGYNRSGMSGYDRNYNQNRYRQGGSGWNDYGSTSNRNSAYNRSGGYNRGSNYGRGGTGWGGYGGNYGRGYGGYDQDYNQGRYGGDYFGSMDADNDFDTDFYDYDFDNEPMSWTYEEVWLIPGPYTGVGPEGYQRSDERIREDIHERLTQHGRLNARNIQVQVNKGEVTLTGTVDNRNAKRMAEDVVDSVTGVKDIHNQLRIQEQRGQYQQGQQMNQQTGQQSQGMNQQQGKQQDQQSQQRERTNEKRQG